MKTTDSVISQEVNKCEFCGVVKPVQRYYLTVKNKHFDDNKGGCYSTFIYYCQDCGIDSHSLAEARREWVEETMKVVDRHTAWKPTIGFGSDEEKGFQKGLIAEANLLKKDLTDLLTGDNQLSEHDQELIREGRAMSDRDIRRGE